MGFYASATPLHLVNRRSLAKLAELEGLRV
jgi:hypothetical protein